MPVFADEVWADGGGRCRGRRGRRVMQVVPHAPWQAGDGRRQAVGQACAQAGGARRPMPAKPHKTARYMVLQAFVVVTFSLR